MKKVGLKTFIIFFFIYIFVVGFIFVGFSNKLTTEEYDVVSNMYREMQYVDDDIKNTFYTNYLLKIVDREIVLQELKKDSLTYSIVVSDNMFSMLSLGMTTKDVYSYISRCDINFSKLVGLETSEQLFKLYRGFLDSYVEDVDYLNTFGESLYKLVESDQDYLKSITFERSLYGLLLVVGYIGLYVFYIKYVDKKQFSNLYEKIKGGRI